MNKKQIDPHIHTCIHVQHTHAFIQYFARLQPTIYHAQLEKTNKTLKMQTTFLINSTIKEQ